MEVSWGANVVLEFKPVTHKASTLTPVLCHCSFVSILIQISWYKLIFRNFRIFWFPLWPHFLIKLPYHNSIHFWINHSKLPFFASVSIKIQFPFPRTSDTCNTTHLFLIPNPMRSHKLIIPHISITLRHDITYRHIISESTIFCSRIIEGYSCLYAQ